MNILCFQLKCRLIVLPISTVVVVVMWLRGEPSRENGSISTPVQDHLPFFFSFCFFLLFVEPHNRILDSTGASWLRTIWLVLLKDNTKEVNKRRREFINNVGLYGGLHVREGQVLNLWPCISCSFMAGNKLNEEERTLDCSKF